MRYTRENLLLLASEIQCCMAEKAEKLVKYEISNPSKNIDISKILYLRKVVDILSHYDPDADDNCLTEDEVLNIIEVARTQCCGLIRFDEICSSRCVTVSPGVRVCFELCLSVADESELPDPVEECSYALLSKYDPGVSYTYALYEYVVDTGWTVVAQAIFTFSPGTESVTSLEFTSTAGYTVTVNGTTYTSGSTEEFPGLGIVTSYFTSPDNCFYNMVDIGSYALTCEDCGEAVDFVSNPGVDGWYVDDNSQFLYALSGGAFNTILEEESTLNANCSCSGGNNFNTNMVVLRDKVFKSANVAPNGTIEVFDGGASPSLINTISLSSGVYCRAMAYNPNDGLIYFTSGYSSNAVNTIDPITYTVNYGVVNTFGGGGVYFDEIFINPVTNQAYIIVNGSSIFNNVIKVVDLTGTPTIITTITDSSLGDVATWFGNTYSPSFIQFNPSNGDVWVTMRKASEGAGSDILIIDSSDYSLKQIINSSGGSYPFAVGPNGTVQSITYYNGTTAPNSDRMFVQYVSGEVYSYELTAPYTETLFVSAIPGAQPNLFYSKLFNKLLWLRGVTITIFNPEDASDTYGAVVLSNSNPSRPGELTDYNQIVFHRYDNSNNVIYVGLDEDNAVSCSEGLIDMYLGGAGPYRWNPITSEWDSLATISVSLDTPAVGQFTVTSTLDSSNISACLLLSTDGITYNPYQDINATLYANAASWSGGRIYTTPPDPFTVKLQINTSNECIVESDTI